MILKPELWSVVGKFGLALVSIFSGLTTLHLLLNLLPLTKKSPEGNKLRF
jgi:hypothetical protein